jgi:hypothetical protein
MTWFIIEFVVVCALVSGFMATHSLATAVVSAAPVVAALVWLRSMQVDEAVLWLVGGVPLLASMLGLVLGQYLRHRAKARAMASVSPSPERPVPSRVMLDAGSNQRSTGVYGSAPGSAAVNFAGVRGQAIWTGRGKTPLSAAIAGGGSGPGRQNLG